MDLFGYRRIWFDIGTANESLAPIILSAGDHDGRIIAVRLWDGAASVSGTGLIARLLFNDNSGGSGGYVEMTALAGEATAAWEVAAPSEALRPGRSTLCVEISQGTTIVCSRLIEALVEPSVIDDSSQEAQDALAEFRAAVARLEDFTVPVVVGKGGTGKTSHTANSVLTGNGTSAIKNVATKSGALFATATNGAASFGTLPIAQGGTGATTVAAARAGLGLGNTDGALPVANGGTGSTSAADARTALGITPANIGAVAKSGDTMTGHLGLNAKELQPKSPNITASVSSTVYGQGSIDFLDASDFSIAFVRPYATANNRGVSVSGRRDVDGSAKVNELRLGVDKNGNAGVLFNGDNARAAWLSALGLPSAIDAAAWLAALGLTVTETTDIDLIEDTPSDITVSELKLKRFGKNVSFRVVFKSSAQITANSSTSVSNKKIGKLNSAWKNNWEVMLNLRPITTGSLYLADTYAYMSGSGEIYIRPGVTIAANSNIAITGSWILS